MRKGLDYQDQFIKINNKGDWDVVSSFLLSIGYRWIIPSIGPYANTTPNWPINPNTNPNDIWISAIKSEKTIDYWHSLIPQIQKRCSASELLVNGEIISKEDRRDKKIDEIIIN